MKNFTRIPLMVILAVVIVFAASSCDEDPEDSRPYGITNFGDALKDTALVWDLNRQTNKVSEIFVKFTEDRDISVRVVVPDGAVKPNWTEIGAGQIAKGILSYSVDKPDQDKLLTKADLITRVFDFWNSVEISAPDLKGNFLRLFTNLDEPLSRQGYVGEELSLGQEIIHYIYVDSDCMITGSGKSDGILIDTSGYGTNTSYFTDSLDLSLKAGWNTICRKQTFYAEGTEHAGKANFSMEVKNPLDLRWVILK